MIYRHPNTNSLFVSLGTLIHLKDTFQQPVRKLLMKCLNSHAEKMKFRWMRWISPSGIAGPTDGMKFHPWKKFRDRIDLVA